MKRKFLLATIALSWMTSLAHADLGVRSYDAYGNLVNPPTQQAAPTPRPQAQNRSGMFAYEPDPSEYGIQNRTTQAVEEPEYRGYNGRTLKQAFLSCKYEAIRAATPGDPSRGILEKMRIRMYVMDTCMNREGFFRTKTMPFLDSSMISSGDFFF